MRGGGFEFSGNPDKAMNVIMNNAHLPRVVILGLVPRICCPIDRKQMLRTGPSMTKEALAALVSRL
ncbi:hypothetical protein Kim5_CH02613 [Rhizobium sp. Kim5]|nr:hypothetical protein Kim5_CH02613 [Rhizobium sp. Kim5]